MRRFLQLALDLVDDLVLHLLDRGARPDRLDDHDAEGEIGIFLLAHAHQAEPAGDDDQAEQEARNGRMANGPARKIERPLFTAVVGGGHRRQSNSLIVSAYPWHAASGNSDAGFRAARLSERERLSSRWDAWIDAGELDLGVSTIGHSPPGNHECFASLFAEATIKPASCVCLQRRAFAASPSAEAACTASPVSLTLRFSLMN